MAVPEWVMWGLTGLGYFYPVAIAMNIYYFMDYYYFDIYNITVNSVVLYIATYQIFFEILVAIFTSSNKYIDSSSTVSEDVSLIIAAYLPNEKDIIFETLEAFEKLRNVQGKYEVILAYNTPYDIEYVESKLKEYEKINPNFKAIRVPDSRSKAQNLNYILDNIPLYPIVGIYDADHHPQSDVIYRAIHHLVEKKYDFVQGQCKIRSGTSTLSKLVQMQFSLMYSVQHHSRKKVFDIGLFGGSNGFWKTSVLKEIRFDHTRLTEDIDCTVRAIKAGYRGTYDNLIVSTEESPPSFMALINQRVRWTQGWLEVSIKHILLPFQAKGYGVWQRVCLFNLFILREILAQAVLFCIPNMVMRYIHYGYLPLDISGGIALYVSIGMYPLAILAAIKNSWDLYYENKSILGWSVIGAMLYMAIESVIIMKSRVKFLFNSNKWVVTPRG